MSEFGADGGNKLLTDSDVVKEMRIMGISI